MGSSYEDLRIRSENSGVNTTSTTDGQRPCPHCGGDVALARGFVACARVNPRSLIPGLVAVAHFGLFFLFAVALRDAACVFGFCSRRAETFAQIIAFGVCMPATCRLIALRMLVCSVCRRAVHAGFGKAVPVSWQAYLPPPERCLRCGYNLRGIRSSGRCSECGRQFEEAWLDDPDFGIASSPKTSSKK